MKAFEAERIESRKIIETKRPRERRKEEKKKTEEQERRTEGDRGKKGRRLCTQKIREKVEKSREKAKKTRENLRGKKTQLIFIPLGPALSLSVSASLSKTRICSLLHPSRPARSGHQSSTTRHHFVPRLSYTTPALFPSSQARFLAEQPDDSSHRPHLPTPIPATTGHHFLRHHDQKNHLGVLYPKVLTGKSFVTLENLVRYCSSSSVFT